MGSARARKAGKRSQGGRPKLEGERYPSGERKPPPPNPVVVQMRRELVGSTGDVTKAENALDVALARGWLTEDEHRAARAYASLYRRAGVDLPRMRTATLGEGEHPDDRERRRAGCTTADSVMRLHAPRDGDSGAMSTLRTMWEAMTTPEVRVMLDVCVLEAWPQFVTMRIRGLTYTDRNEGLLRQGLAIVHTLLDPRVRSRHCSINDRVGGLR